LDISLLLYTPIFYIYINVFMYYITCCQLFFSHYHLSHDGSMYGVHMLTWLGYIDGIHVAIYGSTMDPMGIVNKPHLTSWFTPRGLIPMQPWQPQDFLPGASPRRAPSMRSERSSSSDSETLQPEPAALGNMC
jgi:hypothetical protein